MYDAGLTSFFTYTYVHIIKYEETVLTGTRDKTNVLYLLPLENINNNTQIGKYLEHSINNSYQIGNQSELVKYIHSAAFRQVKSK